MSYRREDTVSAAGRLCDALEREFGRDQIFRDVETIEPGTDFVVAIDRALSSCSVMLVVIGPRWLTLTDRQGQRRLDSPYDWVRVETGRAIARGIRVIPVLVEDAAQILPAQVSPDLQALALRQSCELSDKRWDYDVQQLVAVLARVPGIQRRAASALANPTSKVRKVAWWTAGLIVVATVIAGIEGASQNEANRETAAILNPLTSLPAARGVPMVPPLSICGCWGPVNPGDSFADVRCASGVAVVQPCLQMFCPDGKLQWRALCN